MFEHEIPAVISTMRDLTVGVFEHIEINSVIDVDKKIKYTEIILISSALHNYRHIMVECKESEKGLAGYHWTFGLDKGV